PPRGDGGGQGLHHRPRGHRPRLHSGGQHPDRHGGHCPQRREDRQRLYRGCRGPGHRKNGRPGRVHDPGQPRQGGAAPEAGGDRRQPGGHGGVSGSCRPVSEGAGSPLRQALRAGKRVYRSWNGTNRRSKDFCWWSAAVWRFTAHCSAWMQSWRRWAGCLGF
ncbi:HTH-type transcriptional regulator immR, partial [Dysosmobacter welbionis]